MKNIFILLAIFSASIFANAEATVGKKIPHFEATSINGEKINSEKLLGKLVVIEWFHPLCPFTGKHYKSNNMQNIQKHFREKNVVWISVNTDMRGSLESDKIASIEKWKELTGSSANFYVNDKEAELAKLFNAKVTPHMFIINQQGVLIYQGGIDDKPSAKIEDIAISHNYVSAALDEAINGKSVSIPITKPYGCPVKY